MWNAISPGFELVSPCPIPATITITPRALPFFLFPSHSFPNSVFGRSHAVNNFGEIVSSYQTPFLIYIWDLYVVQLLQNYFPISNIKCRPVGLNCRICWLRLCRGMRPHTHPMRLLVDRGWWPMILGDGLLVAEQYGTRQLKWSRDVKHSTLALTQLKV